MNRVPRRVGRIALLIWLFLPVAVVALLWLAVDRSKGRADPERWRNVPAGPGSGAADRVGEPPPAE